MVSPLIFASLGPFKHKLNDLPLKILGGEEMSVDLHYNDLFKYLTLFRAFVSVILINLITGISFSVNNKLNIIVKCCFVVRASYI